MKYVIYALIALNIYITTLIETRIYILTAGLLANATIILYILKKYSYAETSAILCVITLAILSLKWMGDYHKKQSNDVIE